MKKNNLIIGIALIIIGIILFLANGGWLGFGFIELGWLFAYFWATVFLIIPGLLFHYAYFNGERRSPGLLVPGGILLVLGLVCQFSMLFNAWGFLWPGFILAPAVGLFELYLFGKRKSALLIPIAILTGLSALFFGTFSLDMLFNRTLRQSVIAVAIILIGVLVLVKSRKTET